MPIEPEVESRLATLEARIDNGVADIKTLRDSSGVNWATYIGFAGIILTIVAMVGGAIFAGYSGQQHRMDQSLTTLLSRALDLEYKRGVAETEIASALGAIKKLDTDLQREMRDVNAKTEVALSALDRRLQGEIAKESTQILEGRKLLEDNVREMREYQNVMRGVNATQDERLRSIERHDFGP